jgi:hypothetical protein
MSTEPDRFYTNNLVVVPELLGQSHVFTFEQREIIISLPSEDWFEEDGLIVSTRLQVGSRRTVNQQILDVYVLDADVLVSIPGTTPIPEEALTRPVKAFDLFTEQRQQQLNELADENSKIARRAFDLWIRTLRWKADDSRIGLPELHGPETEWTTYLRDKKTLKEVWGATTVIRIPGRVVITTDTWNKASASLSSGQPVPIYWDLLYDAIGQLERGDLQRTIVDAAVATETYMRTKVHEGLPTDLDASLKDYIDRAPVRRVADKFFLERLNEQQSKTYRTIKKDLISLFEDRNTILHSGQKYGLTEQYCCKLIESVRKLVSLVSD